MISGGRSFPASNLRTNARVLSCSPMPQPTSRASQFFELADYGFARAFGNRAIDIGQRQPGCFTQMAGDDID